MKQMTVMSALEREVAPLIVEVLNLEDVKPEEIDLATFENQNTAIFRCLRALSLHAEQNRVL